MSSALDLSAFVAGQSPTALRDVRVLLINTPLRESAAPNCAPLGPALLASRLRQYGADVSILDLNVYRVKDVLSVARGLPGGRHLTTGEADALLVRHLARHGEPHLIGLSGKITTLRWQRHLARSMCVFCPGALLVSGGGLATEFGAGLFSWMPELDGVCIGDGDDVVIKIARDAMAIRRLGRDGAALGGQLDPYLVDHDGAAIRLVYRGERPRHLDALPLPAWDLLERDVDGYPVLSVYLKNEIWGLRANNSSATPFSMVRSLNTVSSRGCPFSCNYCFHGDRGYCVRGVKSIVDEVRWMSERWDIDFCAFLDDNFLVKADRISSLAGPLGKLCSERGIRWGTHGRLDEAAYGNRMEELARGGCVYVGFGAESASPRVLASMGKGGHTLARGTRRVNGFDIPETMLVGYENTHRAGINGNCTWIHGWTNENLFDLKHSIAYILWQCELTGNPAAVNRRFFQATCYIGTEMARDKKVQARLATGFGLKFGPTGQPICDDALLDYTLLLDDADRVLVDKNGEDVYYGEMSKPLFQKVRSLLDTGNLDAVMRL